MCVCANIHLMSTHSKGYNVNREDSTSKRQLDNPVYDGGTGTHSQTNYSSTGPVYEHVGANKVTGYDVINRRGAPRPHPPPGSHDPTSDQDYNTLETNCYHVLEPSDMIGEEAVRGGKVSRGNDGVVWKQNLQLSLHGDYPQDYKVPNPEN